MKSARIVFWIHVAVAAFCVAVPSVAIIGHEPFGKIAHEIRSFFETMFGRKLLAVLLFSCFLFPAVLALLVVKRMSAGFWIPIMTFDFLLSCLQYIGVCGLLPFRS
jgi:hypothetical protein